MYYSLYLFSFPFSLSFFLHFHSSAKILLHVLNGSDCLAFGFTTLAGANANYLHVIALNFFPLGQSREHS